MLYYNTPPSSISNLVLYPRSAFGRKIIFVLRSIIFNRESMDSRLLQVTPITEWEKRHADNSNSAVREVKSGDQKEGETRQSGDQKEWLR